MPPAWAKANHQGRVAGFTEAAKFGEAVVLAVKGAAATEVLAAASADALAGKVVIDATNPIGGAPQNGVLKFFTTLDESLWSGCRYSTRWRDSSKRSTRWAMRVW